ncbi:MAG: hypothetical protein WBA17_09680 [Saprospiraceae bacterium]
MRKLLLVTLLFLSIAGAASAQVMVDGVNINNFQEVTMIRMIAVNRVFSNKINVFIDYGQSQDGGAREAMEVTEVNSDRRVKFNSVIHAINYLEANGWGFDEAMVLPSDGNASAAGSVQYLFRRKAE